MKSFLSGSWISFKIENMQLSNCTGLMTFQKNLSILDEYYSVISDVQSYNEIICCQIILQELEKDRRRSSKARIKRKIEVGKLKKKKQVMIAISLDDSLFFSNQHLSSTLQELFARVLEASELRPIELFGSPFYNLLLLHRQASNTEAISKDKIETEILSLDEKLHESLMSEESYHDDNETFPDIRKLFVNEKVGFVDAAAKDFEEIKDIHLDEASFILQGRSIFRYYQYLRQERRISEISKWITDSKRRGITRLIYTS